MILINFEIRKSEPNFPPTLKGPCLYLLMGLNDYLGLLVKVDGATSISIILLVDVDVGSFSSYKSILTPWAKHIKTTVWGAPSLGNPSCSKLDFSPLLVAAAAGCQASVAALLLCVSMELPLRQSMFSACHRHLLLAA